MVMVIEPKTNRLLLRQWRQQDREPFAALNSDPHVMEFFSSPLEITESDALADRIERSIAARVALRTGFESVGLDEIFSFTSILNLRSRAVMKRFGMASEPDTFEHPVPKGDRLHEHLAYRMTKAEWIASATRR